MGTRLIATLVVVLAVVAAARGAEAEPNPSCEIEPFVWDIVASKVTQSNGLVQISYVATANVPHTGEACPIAGRTIRVRDRAKVYFAPACGPDGTTQLRGRDPLDYGSGIPWYFRGPIRGTVTCGDGGERTLDMQLRAKSRNDAQLMLHLIGEVDLAGPALTSLEGIEGRLVLP